MTLEKIQNGTELTVKVGGRLDTSTAPQLEEAVRNLENVSSLTFDFQDLEYISSAGLRVILLEKKTMGANGGSFTVININSTIREIFDITGFSGIIDVK